jgi:hypothetical protein
VDDILFDGWGLPFKADTEGGGHDRIRVADLHRPSADAAVPEGEYFQTDAPVEVGKGVASNI